MKTMHRYEPRSPLQAIDPKAFLSLFSTYEEPQNESSEDVSIVTIRGPLSQHDDWWEDSYEAIRNRVDDACSNAAPVVVLRIDSPGGDVAGLFDTARYIRAACEKNGKQLLAHVEGQACSAAYALATAAEKIYASRTAEVGSIGVISARVDESRAMENYGVKVSLITSGARKGDGWPVRPMSDDERASFQADIDGLAAEFFNVVSLRRGIPVDQIAAFEAACYRGDAALKAGLVDELGSFDHVIASLGAAPPKGKPMDEIKEALRAIAEDEECSEDEREQARRALAAMDGEEEESAEDDPESEDGEDDPEAEGEEDDESAEDDEDEPSALSAGSVSASTAAELAGHSATVERRLAAVERRYEAEDRKRLIAAHGGVTPKLAKVLATKPLSEVKAILAGIPKPKRPKLGDAAATTTVGGTRGKGSDNASQLPPEESKSMKRAMGLVKTELGVKFDGRRQVLGAVMDDEEVR